MGYGVGPHDYGCDCWRCQNRRVETKQGYAIRISLTHLLSGETVEFDEMWDYPGYVRGNNWEHDSVFLWSEGNYSCNCNRDLFFHRAKGQAEYMHSGANRDCGQYDDYRVNWIKNLETGNVVYEE